MSAIRRPIDQPLSGEQLTQLLCTIVTEASTGASLTDLISDGEQRLRAGIVDDHDVPHHTRFEEDWRPHELEDLGRLAVATEMLRVDQRAAEERIRDLRGQLKPYDGVRIRVVSLVAEVAPVSVMHEWRNETDSWLSEPKLTPKRHLADAEGTIALDRSILWGADRVVPLLRRGIIELTEPGRRRDRIADNIYHVQVIDPATLSPRVAINIVN